MEKLLASYLPLNPVLCPDCPLILVWWCTPLSHLQTQSKCLQWSPNSFWLVSLNQTKTEGRFSSKFPKQFKNPSPFSSPSTPAELCPHWLGLRAPLSFPEFRPENSKSLSLCLWRPSHELKWLSYQNISSRQIQHKAQSIVTTNEY